MKDKSSPSQASHSDVQTATSTPKGATPGASNPGKPIPAPNAPEPTQVPNGHPGGQPGTPLPNHGNSSGQ